MAQATVGRRGNGLAVRLPGDIVQAIRLYDGERVEVEVQDGGIVIRRAEPRVVFEELFVGKTTEEWRVAHAGAYDWGPDFGREAVME